MHFEVMTLKFLRDAPPEPPKNPFAIFVGEKRWNQIGFFLSWVCLRRQAYV